MAQGNVIDVISVDEMVRRYCERQENEPEPLKATLALVAEKFKPEGWMLAECQMIGGGRSGDLVILPYGGGATFKEPPTHPFSPRGLASDMSVVVAVTKEVR